MPKSGPDPIHIYILVDIIPRKEKRKKTAIQEYDPIFYCQITQTFLHSLSLLLTGIVVSNISKMKFSPFIFSAAALGVSQPALQKCGVGDPSPELRELARTMQTSLDHVKRDKSTLVIPTYLHVVESVEREGTVTSKMLEDQVCKMTKEAQYSSGSDCFEEMITKT